MTSARALVIAQDLSNKQHLPLAAPGAPCWPPISERCTVTWRPASATLHSSFGLKVLGKLPYLSDQRERHSRPGPRCRDDGHTASDLLQKVNALVAQSTGTTVSLTALQSLQTNPSSGAAPPWPSSTDRWAT